MTQWYALLLNDMREPNIENLQVLLVDRDPAELERQYLEQLAPEPWPQEEITPRGRRYWQKVFLKDGPLEWFNPVADIHARGAYEGGIWGWNDEAPPPVGLRITKGCW